MRSKRKSSVVILGVPIDNLVMDEALATIQTFIKAGGFHQIATANVDFLVKSIHDEELHETLCRCDMVLADGMPLLWASRLMGIELKQRITGADLVPRLANIAAKNGYGIYLLGAEESSSQSAAQCLQQNYPGTRIVGRYSPPVRDLEKMDHEEILARIDACAPDILLVAFGNPKQEKWIAMHRHRLKASVCIGVGGSLDFLSGKVERAPMWMQERGLEWLFRLSQEPTRLAGRYLTDAVGLVRYLTVQVAATALQNRKLCPARVIRKLVGEVVVLDVQGGFTGSLLDDFETEVTDAIASGFHLVVNLSATSYIGPDALGCLTYLLGYARSRRREMWLTGLRPLLIRVIRAARLGSLFRTAPRVSDALRRLEPEAAAIRLQVDEGWISLHLDGQLIPLPRQEALTVHRQLQQVFDESLHSDQIDSVA